MTRENKLGQAVRQWRERGDPELRREQRRKQRAVQSNAQRRPEVAAKKSKSLRQRVRSNDAERKRLWEASLSSSRVRPTDLPADAFTEVGIRPVPAAAPAPPTSLADRLVAVGHKVVRPEVKDEFAGIDFTLDDEDEATDER